MDADQAQSKRADDLRNRAGQAARNEPKTTGRADGTRL